MMSHFSRSLRSLAGVAGTTLLATSLAAPAQAEDSVLGYTDLRLSVSAMPIDGFDGGPAWNRQNDDFDDAYRLSVMAIGPICGILPIGCATPPRLRRSSDSSSDTDAYGTYDDLALEQEFVYTDTKAGGYDTLIGFELSRTTLNNDGAVNPLAPLFGSAFADPAVFSITSDQAGAVVPREMYFLLGTGEPDIQVDITALTVHFGWGFEVATRTRGRWHWEFTPYAGAGFASVDWVDGFTGAEDSDDGTYFELGGRVGTYYTFPFGLQIGANVRAQYANISGIDIFDAGSSVSSSGLAVGADVGWRF